VIICNRRDVASGCAKKKAHKTIFYFREPRYSSYSVSKRFIKSLGHGKIFEAKNVCEEGKAELEE
jgi:hypothetical protein